MRFLSLYEDCQASPFNTPGPSFGLPHDPLIIPPERGLICRKSPGSMQLSSGLAE